MTFSPGHTEHITLHSAHGQSVTQTNARGSPTRPFGEWQNHSESVNGV